MRIGRAARWQETYLYRDRLRVCRPLDEVGAFIWREVPSLLEVPCYLSSRGQSGGASLAVPRDALADRHQIEATWLLFCAKGHDLRAGDLLYITHEGETHRYLAGAPHRYGFFQQLLVYRREEA